MAKEITEEQLANMSPEQLQQLQKQNCIFCHIVSGRVASKKVYEDEKVVGVLDINPANPGHVLLLPKEHYQIMPQMPYPEINHIFMVSKAISHACLKALKAGGTNIFVANGAPAGQKAPHFMVHIIPRKEGDGINIFNLFKVNIPENQQKQIYQKIKKSVDSVFGIEDKSINLDKLKEDKIVDVEFEEKIEGDEEEQEEPEEKEEPKEDTGEGTKEKKKGGKKGASKRKKKEKADDEEEEDDKEEQEEKIDLDRISNLFMKKQDAKEEKKDNIDLDQISRLLG